VAFTDSGIHHKNTAASVQNTSTALVTLAGTSAGQLVVVAVAWDKAGISANTTVTDDSGSNIYTRLIQQYTSPECAAILYSVITTGGTLNIQASANGANSADFAVMARVFNNPNASPVSGTALGTAGTSTAPDTGAFTAADADALYVAVLAATTTSATTENQSPGDTDWTLSDENNTNTGGSFVFKIVSGAATSRDSTWLLGVSSQWSTVIGAFKPAAGGAAAVIIRPHFLLLGVGQ
jgi:hypothetical protein